MIDMILTAWERAIEHSVLTNPQRQRLIYTRDGTLHMGRFTDREVALMKGVVMVIG